MTKITVLRGLPASGKSTKGKELVEQGGNTVRLNKDLLRTMLHYDKWTGRNEGITKKAQEVLAKELLKEGLNVVIDDTNLGDRHIDTWKQVAIEAGAKLDGIGMYTDMDECIERDAARTDKKPVGESVIVSMALQYGLYPKPARGIVLCDIDGTIASVDHRRHHVADPNNKNWKAFFEEMVNDKPRSEVLDIVMQYEEDGYDIIFVTARPEGYRKQTEAWIEETFKGYKVHKAIIMRRSGDTRPDTEVKEQMYETYFKDQPIKAVIDDRPSVIRMWQSKGLRVIDVGDGVEF